MKTRASKLENGGWRERVRDCGPDGSGPVFNSGATRVLLRTSRCQSARGLAQSKTWRTVLLTVFCFSILHSSFCLRAWGQSYSIDWFTIDGGGGTSTGGVYQVSDTIGQPDAGPTMSGGNYSVDGGFWSIIAAVQTPGAPTLTVTLTTTNTAIVSWPSPATGFGLQYNTTIGTTNWFNVTNTPSDDGSFKRVIVPSNAGNKFYRLFHP